VAEAHARGFKVIMDLVADHTAWDSVMMKHPEFYKQDAQGRLLPPIPEWTDVAGLNYAIRSFGST
jgi:cyclomaltodextrinase